MAKQKLYLDTSVISHLQAPDTPEKMQDTVTLWENIKNGKYDVYISNTTIDEINDCNEPKRSFMLDRLKEIEITVNDRTIEGVKTIVQTKGLDGIKIYCPSILTGGDYDE